ncbi:hypothetical protein O6H91_09G071200 [Diphasiastrum complanatum]|nr:hypothetical protein O6H91_09G071200 [Diphasiastrum complanatum]
MWDSALMLALWLDATVGPSGALDGKQVVELGAGTGLPGMAAAVYGAMVTLTDRPGLLPGLWRNVEENDVRDRVTVQALEWGGDCADLALSVDFILMSDLLYDEGAMPALCKTLIELSHAHTQVFLAYEMRVGTTECFEVMKQAGLELTWVPNKEMHPDWRQRDDMGILRVLREPSKEVNL